MLVLFHSRPELRLWPNSQGVIRIKCAGRNNFIYESVLKIIYFALLFDKVATDPDVLFASLRPVPKAVAK
jgi:hypothetical protein